MNTYFENFEKVVSMGFSNQWLDKNFEKETLKGFSNQLCQNAHFRSFELGLNSDFRSFDLLDRQKSHGNIFFKEKLFKLKDLGNAWSLKVFRLVFRNYGWSH